ncbi:hypothetical protein OAE74_00615 [Verrucomicrobia bacterium]|jgi:hypothetical protein|nr:hypothetical protein [Verrucomicrobiota bacterium]MDB4663468.1 hypothetical protein [Verrucomicrobiota bacterium]|tara:strand:+ start:70 stop:738 length:669 start_codon:yes stop_codon:yes gene_type:complete
MALRLYPFRQYSEQDVINLFANDTADTSPSTNGNGSAGVFVKVSAGNMDLDPITYADNGYLGKTDYPFIGAAQYPSVPLTFTAATAGTPVLGITLNQTVLEDENGEKLLYNPVKASELQAVLSGQAVPVATRGTFTLADTAVDWVDANMVVNSNLMISANAGKVSGLAPTNAGPLTGQYTIVGKVLATGQRVSSNGESDQFAGTGTGKYALVQIDCTSTTTL